MSQEILERSAEQMKIVYARMRKLDSPGFRHSRRDMKHWLRLANVLQQFGVHGPHYILWAYPHLRGQSKNVYIPIITSSKYVDEYVRSGNGAATRRQELIIKIGIQGRTVQRELNMGRELAAVLLDHDLDLGVVFRYVCALTAGLSVVADQLRTEAELEIALEPLYNELLAQHLPPIAGMDGSRGIAP